MKTVLAALIAIVPLAVAQEIKIPPSLDKLADKAEEVVDVTLDSNLLQLASRFLSDRDPDEVRVKKLVTGLRGIYVRSFTFSSPGQYRESDVEELRAQLRAPGWSRIVGVRHRKGGDNADVAVKIENGKITGLVVIAAEERELTVVNIVGPIDPDDLRDLGGHFGIPKFFDVAPRKKENKEDER
jgi:hypothetical protein